MTCWPTFSSLWDLALGDRFSQMWNPARDTPIAPHSHATGQTFRCFATKPNFMSLPLRSRQRPRISRSAFRLVTSRRSRSISNLLSRHLPVAGEGLHRVGAEHPQSKNPESDESLVIHC